MMGFDPDAYLAKKTQPERAPGQSLSDLPKERGNVAEFNPDAYLSKFQALPESGLEQKGQAFLESAGNEIAFGYLPQIQAGVEKLFGNPNSELDAQLQAQGFQVPRESYVDLRDQNINRMQIQDARDPNYALAGKVAGVVTTMSPIAKGAQALKLVGQGGSGIARLKDATKMGAAMGAVFNPGDNQGVVAPLQLTERGAGAAKGGAFGVVGQGSGEVVGKIGASVKNAPKYLEDLSKIKAFKAAGAMLKDFRQARGDKAATEIGETLLTKNIVNTGDSIEDIVAKTSTAKQETGSKIRQIYGQVKTFINDYKDDMGQPLTEKQKGLLEITKLDGKKMSERIRGRLDQYQKNVLGNTEVKGKMDEILTDIEKIGDDADIADILEARNSLDDRINYGKRMGELPILQKQMHTARDEMTKFIQNRVRVVGKITKNKELIKELKQANKEYGQLATVERFGVDKVARDNANRFFSLGDRMGGSAGATVGALSGDTTEERIKNGILGYVGGKVAGKYGRHSTALAARGAEKLGKALQQPANLAKYGEPLIEAAKRSPQEFQALLQQFSQDPKFQSLGTQGAK
jgi:hypothetical protein